MRNPIKALAGLQPAGSPLDGGLAEEQRRAFREAEAAREAENRAAALAELRAKTPVVSAAMAAGARFPNFPGVQAALTHRQQVQAKRSKVEATLAARATEYLTRRQVLTTASSQALMEGRDPDTAAVAMLTRAYHTDKATLESELDALQHAEDELWRRFLAEFASQIRAVWAKQGAEFRALRTGTSWEIAARCSQQIFPLTAHCLPLTFSSAP
jgi:hypothetical protein